MRSGQSAGPDHSQQKNWAASHTGLKATREIFRSHIPMKFGPERVKMMPSAVESAAGTTYSQANLGEHTAMHSEIVDRKNEITAICRRYRVSRLEVFGSAPRGGDFNLETGEADFLVEYHPSNYVSLNGQFWLEDALGDVLVRKVDLVQPEAVRNTYLQEAINQSRELVYEA